MINKHVDVVTMRLLIHAHMHHMDCCCFACLQAHSLPGLCRDLGQRSGSREPRLDEEGPQNAPDKRMLQSRLPTSQQHKNVSLINLGGSEIRQTSQGRSLLRWTRTATARFTVGNLRLGLGNQMSSSRKPSPATSGMPSHRPCRPSLNFHFRQ